MIMPGCGYFVATYACDIVTNNPFFHTNVIYNFLSYLASYNGITIELCMERNIEKLRKRYPDGFSNEASINRVDK